MIAIIGSIIGFLSSALPTILKLFQDKTDKAHELDLMDKQIEFAKLQIGTELEAVKMQADSREMQALYDTYKTNVGWIDALNGSVRPVLSYAFFILYAVVKYLQYVSIPSDAPLSIHQDILWTENDSLIFCSIISFYFGSRFFDKR